MAVLSANSLETTVSVGNGNTFCANVPLTVNTVDAGITFVR